VQLGGEGGEMGIRLAHASFSTNSFLCYRLYCLSVFFRLCVAFSLVLIKHLQHTFVLRPSGPVENISFLVKEGIFCPCYKMEQ
jgi:hypothetical protein